MYQEGNGSEETPQSENVLSQQKDLFQKALLLIEKAKQEVHKVIIGQEYLVERLFIALLADGHVLLEGVPGLAKTKTCAAITSVISGKMNRIQFTPDLLPSDLIGTEVYRPGSVVAPTSEIDAHHGFFVRKGPVFTNLLIADEINRAPAKVQSALLEAMQERRVTIGEETFQLPEPFIVLATQNPIEQEGTYPLPEAQLDRFLMKLLVKYPSYEEELAIIKQQSTNSENLKQIRPILELRDLLLLRPLINNIFTDDKIDTYIVSLVHATRNSKQYKFENMISWGASPRASLALKISSKCLAFIRGKNFVTPDDVKQVAIDVLRHRVLLTFEAEADGITTDEVLHKLIQMIPIP
jgi:MoxR-like ATPase